MHGYGVGRFTAKCRRGAEQPPRVACLPFTYRTPRGSSWPSSNPTTLYSLFPTPSRSRYFPPVVSLSLLLYAALLSLCLPFVRRGAARYLSVPTTTPAQVYIDRTWKRRMQRYPSVLFSFRSANFSQLFLTATGIFRILNFFSSFKDRWY